MKDFLKFLLKSHFFMLFLVLESISIFLVVRNTENANLFISSANSVSGFFQNKVSSINNYFSLKEQNDFLKAENEHLKNYISVLKENDIRISKEIEKTGYFYQSAIVVKNSVYKPYNIITLNKGSIDGIRDDMAVLSDKGIIGTVAVTGKNYCTVVSMLNSKLGISAKIERTDYFGSLRWDEKDYKYSFLYDIPDHSSLYIGDKVVTSGYSAVFPEGLTIGTVAEFEKEKKSSFYKIKVKLSQDFKKLKHVYIVDYFGKDERLQIEDSTIIKFRF
ncbi:MAG: rod shape-determining protein MreC [Bacteroidales bacterium]|nr:rod shape-determining protein MreC [Bacteroidales bacterium]